MAVAEEQNFTRAAGRLHIVQSAVSAAVKTLEQELGAPLLDRNPRRVLLTDAGAELLPRARAILDAARDAADAVAEVRGALRGSLRIGTMTSIKLIDLPALLGEYHRRHPGVHLRTMAAPSGSQGLINALTERRLDVALVANPGPRPAGIALTKLARSVLDLAVPSAHPLACRRSVALEELADEDFIDSPTGYGNRTVSDRAFAAAGLSRRVTIEITDVATATDYVRHGLGIALLPRFIVEGTTRTSGVAVIPVTGANLDWPLSLATQAERPLGAAARALIDLLLETLGRSGATTLSGRSGPPSRT